MLTKPSTLKKLCKRINADMELRKIALDNFSAIDARICLIAAAYNGAKTVFGGSETINRSERVWYVDVEEIALIYVRAVRKTRAHKAA